MYINGKPIEQYGAELRTSYKAGGVEISANIFQGRNRSAFTLLNQTYGLKQLMLPMVFRDENMQKVTIKKSLFDGELFGKEVELIMDDGFLYRVYLQDIGDAVYKNEALIECDYTCVGFRHGETVKIEKPYQNIVVCDSTVPFTDVILSATVGKSSEAYQLGTVTFKNVAAGDTLTVDGINKRILVNGAPGAQKATWIKFPSLTPGQNIINCIDSITAEYQPVYF